MGTDDCWGCEKTLPDDELVNKVVDGEVVGRYCKDCAKDRGVKQRLRLPQDALAKSPPEAQSACRTDNRRLPRR